MEKVHVVAQHSSQIKHDDFSVKSLLNVSNTTDISNRKFLVYAQPAKHEVIAFALLELWYQLDGFSINIARFFLPIFFQGL